jgi:hypothetical protein
MISNATNKEGVTNAPTTHNLEEQTLIVSSHVVIRDAQTKQTLVNKRGS